MAIGAFTLPPHYQKAARTVEAWLPLSSSQLSKIPNRKPEAAMKKDGICVHEGPTPENGSCT